MAFRIREREEKRKENLAVQKQSLVKAEAQIFKELKPRAEDAEYEFIKKLNNIRSQLKDDGDAQDLALRLQEKLSATGNAPVFHQKLLASVILELL